MWELDYKESWALKNWCFWIVVFEKTLENPLDCKIRLVNPKGSQSWIFIGRTNAEAETPVFGFLKNWLTWKNPVAGKDWRWEDRGVDRGWDGWMASLIQWTWVWANSGSWWWRGKPGMLQSMGSPIVRHDWATVLNWTELGVEYDTRKLSRQCLAKCAINVEIKYSLIKYVLKYQLRLNKCVCQLTYFVTKKCTNLMLNVNSKLASTLLIWFYFNFLLWDNCKFTFTLRNNIDNIFLNFMSLLMLSSHINNITIRTLI